MAGRYARRNPPGDVPRLAGLARVPLLPLSTLPVVKLIAHVRDATHSTDQGPVTVASQALAGRSRTRFASVGWSGRPIPDQAIVTAASKRVRREVTSSMPLTRWSFVRGVLGILALVTIGPMTSTWGADRCSSPVGQIVSLQGTIEIADEIGGASPAWGLGALNQSLCMGELIRVGDRSRAEIALVNQSKVRIDQNTTVRLTRIAPDGGSMLAIARGAAYFFSRQPRVLEIDTPYVTAGIEGTEFLVRVEEGRSLLTVFEGKVAWSNDQGRILVSDGESAIAEEDKTPARFLVVRPRDEVQWALYYPPILLPLLSENSDYLSRMLRTAVEAVRIGDIPAALKGLDEAAGVGGDGTYHLYRAAILLMVGRSDEALPEIDQALASDPDLGLAYALRSVIAVAQDDRQEAIEAARRAVELDPAAAAPLIAQSYAKQSIGDIEGARDALERAVTVEPDNALTWSRLSEVQMMLGDRRRGRQSAERAHNSAADVAQVWTVLGYSAGLFSSPYADRYARA